MLEIFLSITNSILTGNNVPDSAASNIDDFFGMIQCFFSSAE
jgi:hypothetical protein